MNIIAGLTILGFLTASSAYALMFAVGVDAPWPARLLRRTWRIAVWTLKASLIGIIVCGLLLFPLAAVYVVATAALWAIWRLLISPHTRRERRLTARVVEDWT